MANCFNDCIHGFVCQYANHDEYPSAQQLKDDCRYCKFGTDVVPKSEYDRLEKLFNDMTQEANGYLNRLYGIRAEVARQILAEIRAEFYGIKYFDELGYASFEIGLEELKKKYIDGD